jgi:putative SOS response-associated peptidase YedK
MCGRYGFGDPARLDALPLGVALPALAPRWNVAPSQRVPLVVAEAGGRRATLARWGLVPSWATDPAIGNRLINARGETVREKPAFRAAFRARRGLLPADLFYEWQSVPGARGRQPWCIRLAGEAPFAFGALWERWRPRDAPASEVLEGELLEGELLESCAIVTTAPNAVMAPIHDRMPLILAPADYDAWLDPATPLDDVAALIRPSDPAPMRAWRVSTWVNAPAHDDARCIVPLEEGERGVRATRGRGIPAPPTGSDAGTG